MNALITGVAGFIGSTLADRLLTDGHNVVGIDNFSTGERRFLCEALRSPRFRLIEGDVLDREALRRAMPGCDAVYHLAANADVRHGLEHPLKDVEQNTVATVNVLSVMCELGITQVAFSSTGSVYGEAAHIPTPEDVQIPRQTSLYGASKLGAEGFLDAFSEAYGIRGCIFRFVSVLGERYSHGHVVDFCRQLLRDPSELRILGDGQQKKSYMYVQDCVDAMASCFNWPLKGVLKANLGTDEYCCVNDSVNWICESLGVNPRLVYSGGDRGWIGDNPFIFLDCNRVRTFGWRPSVSIREGIKRTVAYLVANPWLLSRA